MQATQLFTPEASLNPSWSLTGQLRDPAAGGLSFFPTGETKAL